MSNRFRHGDYRDFTGMPASSAHDDRMTRPPSLRLALLTACAGLVALMAACDDGVRITSTRSGDEAKGVLTVIDALQCPDTLGSLTRKGSAQADGTVCTYAGPRGAEVSLHLVQLGEDPIDTVLKRFETLLSDSMPRTVAQLAAAAAQSDAEAARADAEAARADAEVAGAQATAEAASAEAASSGDSAHISAPGMQIDAEGDRARVSLPGIHVDADGDKANVRIGGFTIRADDSQARISGTGRVPGSSTEESVSIQALDNAAVVHSRAPGEATRQTWRLTDDTPSDAGWRMVGYEARGPRGGPIVVATVRVRERRSDDVFEDAKDLVALNVGE